MSSRNVNYSKGFVQRSLCSVKYLYDNISTNKMIEKSQGNKKT